MNQTYDDKEVAEMDREALENYRAYLMNHHEQWNDVRKAQGGSSTDTQADTAMKEIMDKVIDVDAKLCTIENN